MTRPGQAMARGRAGRGYVLPLVLGALVMMALVAGRFAQRMEGLREQSSRLTAYADARLAASNATATALYWISTRELGPAGFGPPTQPRLWADGRPYLMPDGAELQVQDLRGLYPLNMPDRQTLRHLLALEGAPASDADALIDVLLDYTDTDNLKRLNGAETAEYAALSLPPPRDDWLLSVRELQRMPLWRDRPELVQRLAALASTGRQSLLNPNTAPLAILRALLPAASAEQLELFDTLRHVAPFTDGAAAQRATGLPLDSDAYMFHVGEQFRLDFWAPGLPQSLQYNLLLLPGGQAAPWLITEVHPAPRPAPGALAQRGTAFPLVPTPTSP